MFDWIKKLFDGPATVSSPVNSELMRMLQAAMRDSKSVYATAAARCLAVCPDRIKGGVENYRELMLDLHRGLIIKILIEIAECDRTWNAAERRVAVVVLQHVWGVRVSVESLTQALQNVAEHAEVLKWEKLVEPFVVMPPLADLTGEVTVGALRIASLIAKADGQVSVAEATRLREIQAALDRALQRHAVSADAISTSSSPADGCPPTADPQLRGLVGSQAVAVDSKGAAGQPIRKGKEKSAQPAPLTDEERRKMFDDALKDLDQLIGLEPVKRDIRQLVDFLKVQEMRKEHQLPTTPISLHTIFAGNPGTGKTTVARILGHIFCGLKILDRGHTIETDRSGLVAQYAGQTGPRTQERVDEALDGVLFVDEAYSLIAEQGEDTFGEVAVQTLLKRMEDDRERLIVILAGYPGPMQRMLRSNPGLSSRFQRTFQFSDYTAEELLRIFHLMCRKHHYRLPKQTQRTLMDGFQLTIQRKDEHFGNGRLVRNVFELAIRRQATRIVDIAPLTRALLTTLEPDDIDFEDKS